jgi:toxin secretion/phage lysis holin
MTALVAAFGQYWFLFAGLLICNIVDWISGWMRSRLKGESCSRVGAVGAMKKVWYWVVIAMAFFIGFSFQQMGQTIGVPLSFMDMIGWFTLANYLVNEIRSILENLVEMDVAVPMFLVKGLRIAAEKIDAAANIGEGEGDADNKEAYPRGD